MQNQFRFKNFNVSHERSTQKVTTDSVLLGSWVDMTSPCKRVLDVGTGCGLLALMCAQKCEDAIVDALEIDGPSVEESDFNFRQSPWSSRLRVYEADFNMWDGRGYDLIISNPPYFDEDTVSPSENRKCARHGFMLDAVSFVRRAAGMIAAEGRLALVCPWRRRDAVRLEAELAGLGAVRECMVSAVEGRRPVLSLFQLGRIGEPMIENLAIKSATDEYTDDYIELTKDFYLFLH